MSDELRDEYEFDYKQAKPNRFVARLAPGSVATPPVRPELSDEQKHLLEDLYAGVPMAVDDLPYTDEMEHIHRDFVTQSGLSLTIRDVYKAIKNLGRQGRLGGKFRMTTPA